MGRSGWSVPSIAGWDEVDVAHKDESFASPDTGKVVSISATVLLGMTRTRRRDAEALVICVKCTYLFNVLS